MKSTTAATSLDMSMVYHVLSFIPVHERMLVDKTTWKECSGVITSARRVIARNVSSWMHAKNEFLDNEAESPVIHPSMYVKFYPLVYRESLEKGLRKMTTPPDDIETFEELVWWVYDHHPTALLFAGW